MPIYEYHCDACDTVFEEWHKHADDITEQPCPKCHAAAHRFISNTSFVLKGSGWYVTEYGNKKAEPTSTDAAKDSTPPAETAPVKESTTTAETTPKAEAPPPAAPKTLSATTS